MATRNAGIAFACSALLLAGCDTFENARGAKSILALTRGPSITDAAAWAVNEYNANDRYRGIMILANQPFGGDPVYMQLYVDAITDSDSGVRAAGVRGLALHGSPEHVPLLIDTLDDEDVIVRLDSARALQRIHNPVAIEPLLARTRIENEENELVRAEAARALGQYPQSRIVDALIAALDDPNLGVNEAARSSLRTLTGQDFGVDIAGWVNWTKQSNSLFAARSAYMYPAFYRDWRLIEYLPFVPNPPNESASLPVGMSPAIE
ncbi:MAG: HEAT repeat domain-containing protein [Phycisphaerales bacterium]|nr:HEAT repeat domain-containing protein [Phycisphaerales bacterium]